MTSKFDRWPWKKNRAPLLYCLKLCTTFQSYLWIQAGVTIWKCSIGIKIGDFFVQSDLDIWWMTLKNNLAPLLWYFKLCASFQSHRWIQTGVTVRKRPMWVKIGDFFVPCYLDIWQMTLKNNLAPFLCYFKLGPSFHNNWWIQTGVTVRKLPIWVKIDDHFSHVALKFDRWPWKTIWHLS